MKTDTFLKTMIDAYIEAVYFTDTGDTEQPPTTVELAPEAHAQAMADCTEFLQKLRSDAPLWAQCCERQVPATQLGVDLWLTRNHHGAGFWDRGNDTLGDQLTELAHAMGEQWSYVGDDGKLYLTN